MEIIVRSHAQSKEVPFSVNGKRRLLQVGKVTEVPDEFKAALLDADIDFEIVGKNVAVSTKADADKNPANSDDHAPVVSQTASSVDLTILDGNVGSVIKALAGLDLSALEALKDAETKGKTRSTVVAAIEKAVADLATE